jgi:hypothetical protein
MERRGEEERSVVDGAFSSSSPRLYIGGLLKGKVGRSLEPQVGLEVLSDLADQPPSGKGAAGQELGALLYLAVSSCIFCITGI